MHCLICEHQKERLSHLESQVKALTEMYKELSLQCANMIDHKIRQIDENRKVSRRMNLLEASRKPHKCPLCDGQGGFYISGTMDSECSTCEATGIVWG